MGTFEGSDRRPFPAQRRLSEEQKPEMTDKQKAYYHDRIAAWKDFKQSPIGDACLKVAEAKMQELMDLLAAPAIDVYRTLGLPPSEATEVRAEIRGQYKVWHDILHEQEVFFEGLARMQVEKTAREVAKGGLAVPPGAGKIVTP